jgi:hypothetical protein
MTDEGENDGTLEGDELVETVRSAVSGAVGEDVGNVVGTGASVGGLYDSTVNTFVSTELCRPLLSVARASKV